MPPASQTWQRKACQAPVRNEGPLTRRIGTALLVVGAVCIGIRFLARWQIQNSSIGWDDWTILVSYLLLIPSTAIVQISSFVLVGSFLFLVLTLSIVTYHGMGKDIWNVQFDNITLMLKVRSLVCSTTETVANQYQNLPTDPSTQHSTSTSSNTSTKW